jgi:DNA primase
VGRVSNEDLAVIRSAAPIEDVISEFVALRPAGGGSLKGLCPFHDERSPSFHVTPEKKMFYCFGCGEGGDAIAFLQKAEGFTFVDAVRKIAQMIGLTVDIGETTETEAERYRVLRVNEFTAGYYRGVLHDNDSSAAAAGRKFLTGRLFPETSWDIFGVGVAGGERKGLITAATNKGYILTDLTAAGLTSVRDDGEVVDKFRNRVMWPIRDGSGNTIGFGGRKLQDTDLGPKYLNTPETIVYRKSSVLYGLDLARKDVAKTQTVVIVEGYTDVMACHLAGVTTAVATCGTAFSADHTKVLRRFLADGAGWGGEVVFTFDGDAAGQRAAVKAFTYDQAFTARTYVAVAAGGLDPCDLRREHGDAEVRELIASKVPLFEFVIRTKVAGFDLSTPAGRLDALNIGADVVARIKDVELRPEYGRLLSGWVGVPTVDAMVAVQRAVKNPRKNSLQDDNLVVVPVVTDNRAVFTGEREFLKCALQCLPAAVEAECWDVTISCFVNPVNAAIWGAVTAAGESDAGTPKWVDLVLQECPDDACRRVVRELIMENVTNGVSKEGVNYGYARQCVLRLLLDDVGRGLTQLKSDLLRAETAGDDIVAETALTDIIVMESYRTALAAELGGFALL